MPQPCACVEGAARWQLNDMARAWGDQPCQPLFTACPGHFAGQQLHAISNTAAALIRRGFFRCCCPAAARRDARRTQIVTEGDSFLVAFHTAFEAVAFCLELQHTLLDTPWPTAVLKLSGCQPVYDAEGIVVMQVGKQAGAAAWGRGFRAHTLPCTCVTEGDRTKEAATGHVVRTIWRRRRHDKPPCTLPSLPVNTWHAHLA